MTIAQRCFFSEVCSLIHLALVMPATNAASDRNFSSMRRLKTYLRSKMLQSCLNHIMLLHVDENRVDNLNLELTGIEFVHSSEHRHQQLGHFQQLFVTDVKELILTQTAHDVQRLLSLFMPILVCPIIFFLFLYSAIVQCTYAHTCGSHLSFPSL